MSGLSGSEVVRGKDLIKLLEEEGLENDKIMKVLALAFDGCFGVEPLRVEGATTGPQHCEEVVAEYVNMGDIYALTWFLDIEKDKIISMSYGDWLEEWGSEHVVEFPSVDEVSEALAGKLAYLKEEFGESFRTDELDEGDSEIINADVRLQVENDGAWAVHCGDAQYDQSGLGYWGSGGLSADMTPDDVTALARQLLEEAAEVASQDDKVCRFADGRLV